MSSRSRRSSSSARRGRRSATSTATSTSNEAQPVSDELAALISSTVREEIRRLSTAPPPTSADHSAGASSADLQSASQVLPTPGCDDLLGPPMGLDLEAGPSTSPCTSQSAALSSVPTKLSQRILRGDRGVRSEVLRGFTKSVWGALWAPQWGPGILKSTLFRG